MNDIFSYPTVLSVAGSDCSGGAGVQADVKTISALGVYAATAITAITVQNTLGVQAVHPVQADVVGAQMEAVMSDLALDAVKIGMVGDASVIRAIARQLRRHPVPMVICDPVMVSTSGHRLMSGEAMEALVDELIGKLRPIDRGIGHMVGIKVTRSTSELCRDGDVEQLLKLLIKTLNKDQNLLTEGCRRGGLSVSVGKHRDALPLLSQRREGLEQLLECGDVQICQRLLQHQRLRGVVDILRGESEVDKLGASLHTQGDKFLLDKILYSLHIVVGGLLDLLHTLSIGLGEFAINVAQSVE